MPRLSTKVVKAKPEKPKALFVEMSEADLERYKTLAVALDMSMRQLVMMALERLISETSPAVLAHASILADEPGAYEINRDLHQPLAGDDGRPRPPSVNIAVLADMAVQTARRVGVLERRLDAIEKKR